MSVDHYENFPVASWVCPPRIRPAVAALYHFARTADDLADEGDAAPARRLADLGAYRDALALCLADQPDALGRWPAVFEPLRRVQREHRLDGDLLRALLDAFEQDVRNPPYADRAELLDYSRRSADPIGRLMLQLYGIDDPAALRRSDAICSALQLINFWQDMRIDQTRGRCYVPHVDLRRHGLSPADLQPATDSPAIRSLVKDLCDWADGLMRSGAPLVHALPGRVGWELRLVVQGGLRVLEKIRRMNHATLIRRPTLTAADAPLLMWRAIAMRPGADA